MRANVDILEKYIENLVIKKNLLDSSVEAYKLDISEYLSFLENKEKNILNSNEDLFIEYFKEVEDKYSVASFKRKYSTIRNFYKFLLKNRYIDKIFKYKLTKKLNDEISKDDKSEVFKKNEYEAYISSLTDNFNEVRLKLISRMIAEAKISLINIFEIEIKDLVKYNFEKIIVFRNSKIITYEISPEISKELKEYYKKHAVEKRYLFGSYKKSSLISDLKRYNLDFKTLKNCLQEDEEEINKNIREIYFKIGIGDN